MAMSYEETKAQNNKANLADAQRKGLADASGNYKQDELGRTYNTDTAKWEAGPTTSVARAGYTNESSGGGSGGSNALSYNSALAMANGSQTANTANTANSATYNPVNQQDYMKNVLSYDDALAMAKQTLTPQYQSRYEQSAAQAAQNLGASGLYDSVYGQALAADAQRDIDRDLEAAVQQWAQQLVGSSKEEAMALLQLAINENQFGSNFNQSAMLEDRAYNERMLDRMIAQANSDRDYNLAQQAQQLKERAQNYYETQSNWQMGGFDNQYQMQQALAQLDSDLKMKETAAAAALKGQSGGGGSSGGGVSATSLATPLATTSSVASPVAATSSQISAPNSAATGGYDSYSDAGAVQVGNTAAEAYTLYNQANIVRLNEGNVSAVDWISRNASSMAVADELMKQLNIPNTAYNTWLGEQYSRGLITKEQYLSAARG